MRRLILNCNLLRYAGVLAVIGETEGERDGYIAMAAGASQSQEEWQHADNEEREYMARPWTELAIIILRGIVSSRPKLVMSSLYDG